MKRFVEWAVVNPNSLQGPRIYQHAETRDKARELASEFPGDRVVKMVERSRAEEDFIKAALAEYREVHRDAYGHMDCQLCNAIQRMEKENDR